jgi:hypothetical protein
MRKALKTPRLSASVVSKNSCFSRSGKDLTSKRLLTEKIASPQRSSARLAMTKHFETETAQGEAGSGSLSKGE